MTNSITARSRRPFALCVAALLAMPSFAVAQEPTGTIVGRIVDARSGEGLSDVGIQVVGSVGGTMSGLDGRFAIRNIRAGTVTLQARRIGYAPKTVTGLMLEPRQTLEVDVTLDLATVQLNAQVVSAAAECGTVEAALDQQRTATGVVNAVTREQMARSPDGDAAQAVQRVSGVTVQEGKYVMVRGLGERYTTASLNGARIPSPEPEQKVVPLDLFPSGLLQSVTTSKTFTPDQPGDFSGAQVDIRTREFPGERTVTYSIGVGVNSATGRAMPIAPGAGGEWLGMASARRALPTPLARAGNLQDPGISQGDINGYINAMRNSWRAPRALGAPASSLGMTVGGSDEVLGQQVGYVGSLTYSYGDEVRLDEVRAQANPGATSGTTSEINRFTGTTGRTSVLWGGLLNISTMLGSHSRIAVNNTYNRSADNDARVERGWLENQGIPVHIERLQYVERSVWSSQLLGEHEGSRNRLTWSLTGSSVDRREPDRSEYVAQVDSVGTAEVLRWYNLNEGAVRTYATLSEWNWEGRADLQREIGPSRVKVGVLGRTTRREADNRAYNIIGRNMPDSIRALPPEVLFGGRFTAPDSAVLELAPLGQGGSYGARDNLGAAYGMAEIQVGSQLRLIGGARVESSRLAVDAASTLGTPTTVQRTWTDVLPSLALNLALRDDQNLRFSVSRTLARPEYREVSDITSREVLSGTNVRGNPDLVRTLIDNLDVRWELYPRRGEVLSIGGFAKRFALPIERVARPSSNENFMTFVNAERATNYGVELEARKGLGSLVELLEPVTAFANVTVMDSRIFLGAAEVTATNPERRMVGQAPFVLNTGLTWTHRRGASATVLYNRVGDRLAAAGERPLPDVVEHARDLVDVSVRLPLRSGLVLRVDGKNLLDAPHSLTQGAVTREWYRTGRGLTFGATWNR